MRRILYFDDVPLIRANGNQNVGAAKTAVIDECSFKDRFAKLKRIDRSSHRLREASPVTQINSVREQFLRPFPDLVPLLENDREAWVGWWK